MVAFPWTIVTLHRSKIRFMYKDHAYRPRDLVILNRHPRRVADIVLAALDDNPGTLSATQEAMFRLFLQTDPACLQPRYYNGDGIVIYACTTETEDKSVHITYKVDEETNQRILEHAPTADNTARLIRNALYYLEEHWDGGIPEQRNDETEVPYQIARTVRISQAHAWILNSYHRQRNTIVSLAINMYLDAVDKLDRNMEE